MEGKMEVLYITKIYEDDLKVLQASLQRNEKWNPEK
jgi:hypothetical protein